jgi:hypothetical protein
MAGLEEMILMFRDAGIDGAGLLQLRQLSTTDSSTFYSTAESRLGINKFGLVKCLSMLCPLAFPHSPPIPLLAFSRRFCLGAHM